MSRRRLALWVLAAGLALGASAQHSEPAPATDPAHAPATPAHGAEPSHTEEPSAAAEPAHGAEAGLPAPEHVTSEPLHEASGHGGPAAAAHGEGHGEEEHHGGHGYLGATIWGIPELVWRSFNFLLFFGFLAFILRKIIPEALKNRAAGIREALERAEREKAEAITQLKALEEKMGHLEGQVRDIEAQARQEAEAEKVRAQEEAAQERERIVVMAKQEMDRRVKEGKEILRRHGADLAAKLASEQAAGRIGPAEHQKLVSRYADDLAENKP